MKAQAEWTARTEGPVVAYSASKRDKVIGIGLSAKHQGQRSYQTALTGRRHDCTRPATLKHRRNHLAKRAPSRQYAAVRSAKSGAAGTGVFRSLFHRASLYHNRILTLARSLWTGNNRCGIDLSFVLSKLMNSPGKIIAFRSLKPPLGKRSGDQP